MYVSHPIFASALAATTLIPSVSAFFRMPCPSRLVQERIDPIITPGHVSAHVHTVAGGNGFGYTMDYAQARASTCSSCPIKQDLSAYWTPKLYFRAKNGSFIGVPQAGDGQGVQGGMTVYYLQRPGPNKDKLHAFPPGFRMIAGNPFQRNFTGTFAAKAASFVCLDYNGKSSETNGFPKKNCPDGIRTQIFFPSCWNGKNLTSPDQSHMSYPETGDYNGGTCPKSHPVHMVSLFYETIYSTGDFADMWYGSEQPFVLAQGDPTGYGMHGDFVNGWDVDTLQKAIDNCNADSGVMEECPYFDFFTSEESQACKVPVTQSGSIDGPMAKLPGCNPVSSGPALVQPPKTCDRYPKVFPPKQMYTDQTAKGFKYIGCGTDDVGSRTFTGASSFAGDMTVEKCVDLCKSKGYKYAGLEYSSQCFCDNKLAADRAPRIGVVGSCSMPCAGNSEEICGAGNALSIYQACGSGSCTNTKITIVGGLPSHSKTKKREKRGHLGQQLALLQLEQSLDVEADYDW